MSAHLNRAPNSNLGLIIDHITLDSVWPNQSLIYKRRKWLKWWAWFANFKCYYLSKDRILLGTVGRPGTHYVAQLAGLSLQSAEIMSVPHIWLKMYHFYKWPSPQQKLYRACLAWAGVWKTDLGVERLSRKDKIKKKKNGGRGNSQAKITEMWKNKIFLAKTRQVRAASKDGVFTNRNWKSTSALPKELVPKGRKVHTTSHVRTAA